MGRTPKQQTYRFSTLFYNLSMLLKLLKIFLVISFLVIPLPCPAGMPGFMKERMGTLSGQIVKDTGEPLQGGGIVSFFSTHKGIPPLVANMHRIPDSFGRMEPDGKFSATLPPGSYYMGILIITDPTRRPGPPRAGEIFYFARDDRGELRQFKLGMKEISDVGNVVAALPQTFSKAKNLITVTGKLVTRDGKPFEGGVVLVKSDLNNQRPEFVSQKTGKDGMFKLELPANTSYFLLGREQAGIRPVPGTFIGTYGSLTPIDEGGALPVGGISDPPADTLPAVDNRKIGPGDNLPATVSGKPGEILSGIEIIMFRMPVPGEQRERLQGTLGFGDEFRKKMDQVVPLESLPEEGDKASNPVQTQNE